MRIRNIISNYRILDLQRNNLIKSFDEYDRKIYEQIENHVDQYIEFYNLTDSQVYDHHLSFLKIFLRHQELFNKDKKYPYERDGIITKIPRIQYDISLLLSCLLTKHRFEIMKNLSLFMKKNMGKVAIIGTGPGLEISLTKDLCKSIVAYDIEISDFVKIKFPRIFKKELFRFSKDTKYDYIFAIELLEHLHEPTELLRHIYQSLEVGGVTSLTTAKNIPQFDHLYNFDNEDIFERDLDQIGFKIKEKKIIKHNYLRKDNDVNNIFYILKK